MTYNEAYSKIIAAYFKDEIKPFSSHFCFCGTLCGGSGWVLNGSNLYSDIELGAMERGLYSGLEPIGLVILSTVPPTSGIQNYERLHNHPKYEDALFNGMCAALDVLKEIHRSRGEDVDGLPPLTKRKKEIQVTLN